jgi:hypothetical protein
LAWSPAYTTEAYVPERIFAFYKHGNGIADEHAKLVASEHAISQDMLDAITNQDELVSIVARWIGHAGVIVSQPCMQDSAGCPSAIREKRRDSEEKGGCISRRMRPLDRGGHRLVDAHGGWRCSICKVF